MINVPEEIKTLLKQSGVQKNFKVSFPNGEHPDLTNTQIISESVEFTESLCSQDSLKFGLCEASTISFETFGVGNIKGKTIDCSLEIDCSSLDSEFITEHCTTPIDLGYPVYSIPYGRFIVESCPRDSSNMQKRKVTAYTTEGFDMSPWKKSDVMNHYKQFLFNFYDSYYSSDSTTPQYSTINIMSNIFAAKQIEPDGSIYTITRQNTASEYPYSYMRTSEAQETDYSEIVRASYYSYYFRRQIGFGNRAGDVTCVTKVVPIELPDSCIESLNQTMQQFKRNIYSRATNPKPIFDSCVRFIASHFDIPLAVTRENNTIVDAQFIGNYIYPIHYRTNAANTNPESIYFYKNSLISDRLEMSSASVQTRLTISAKHNGVVIATAEFTIDPDLLHFEVIVSDIPRQDYSLRYDRGQKDGDEWLFTLSTDIYNMLLGDCRELVQNVAELNGLFFKLNRVTNRLIPLDINQGLGLYPADTVFPRDNLYPAGGNSSKSFLIDMSMYSKAWYDDYPTKRYSAITCTYTDTNNEKQTKTYTIVDLTLTDDNGELIFNAEDYQVYDISDNEIIKSNTYTQAQIQTILQTIASNIDDVIYMPADIDCVGLPYIEAGDVADVITADGSFETIVLRRTLSGIQALFDNYESK